MRRGGSRRRAPRSWRRPRGTGARSCACLSRARRPLRGGLPCLEDTPLAQAWVTTSCTNRCRRLSSSVGHMSTTEDSARETTQLHGGRLVAQRLKAHGVTKLFTLSGGHLFSIYDGCRAEGIDIVDTRHEQTAAFAAEGWAKVTREPGVAALTAGPGVTNGMSAMASAHANDSPMLVLGGRAPAMRWGQGSLQEIDHIPFVRPLTKFASTAGATAEIPALIDEAWAAAVRPHSGPAFVDLPLDHVFMEAGADEGEDEPPPRPAPPVPEL